MPIKTFTSGRIRKADYDAAPNPAAAPRQV